MNSLNYFGVDITSAGLPTAPHEAGYEVATKQDGSTYQKIILKDNIIVGMILVGSIEKSGIIFGLMRDRINVESFKQSLLADDFGLAFLPRSTWQGQLEAPPELTLQSAPFIQTEEETFLGE